MANFFLLPINPPPPPFPPLQTSLYVGDLHREVTEHDLHALFSTFGPVNNIHLYRDPFTHRSLCYAIISFHNPFHANAALTRLNHTELKGKVIRIMWVQRDRNLIKTGIGNLFVKNFDSSVHEAILVTILFIVIETKGVFCKPVCNNSYKPVDCNPFAFPAHRFATLLANRWLHFTTQQLESVFGVFGDILSCKIAKDDDGKSKGFGFVQFLSEESASDALSALNGSFLNGKKLTVAKFVQKRERKEPKFTNVYVKNFDRDFTENALKERFSKYGKITSAVIMKDDLGKSRGFGFVNFESHVSAKKAVEAENGAKIGTNKLFVGRAMRKAEREVLLRRSVKNPKPTVSNLFVRNLASFVTKKDVEHVFGAYGDVTFASVVRDNNGVSKGIAYICFSKPEEARKAKNILNGCYYNGRYMGVTLAPEIKNMIYTCRLF